MMLLHSLRHALPHALDRAVLHFAVEAGSRHDEITNWRGAFRNTVMTMPFTSIAASNTASSPVRGSDRNARMPS